MPKLKNQMPKLCRNGKSAISWHDGKKIYHGVWGSPESDRNYKRFIAALLENPVILLRNDKEGDILVSELAAGFLKHIESKNMDTTEVKHFKNAIEYLVELYGEFAVNDFSPKKLKACRSLMVRTGTLCRKFINKHTSRIVRIFSWGTEEEFVNPSVVHALKEVKTLRRGEEGTHDNPPRKEVPDDVIRQTLPFLSPTVAAMVRLQRLTGMRPSEVYRMTVGDINRTRNPELWYYVQKSHKTEQYIGEKSIPLGKPEQELLTPYLDGKKADAAVFSPRTAMEEWHTVRRANRKTKVQPSQQERARQRAENPADRIREFYDHQSYGRAVKYAIKKGNRHGQKIPHWTPYQLRHAAGTDAEKMEGLDKAQALLGHTSANTTKRYAHGRLAITEEMARNRRNPFEKDSG